MEDVIFLKQNPIFNMVGSEELKAIAAIADYREFDAGDIIVKEGEPGDSLFFVKEGQIQITKKLKEKETTLATLGQTSCFGEMVIFDNEPRSASCYAHENCLLLVIQKSDLLEVILQYPQIALQLFKVLGGRLRAANEKVKELTNQIESQNATSQP